jgi:hypothetical protein
MHVELRVSLGGSIEVRAVDELGAPQACKLALKVDGQPYGWRSTTAKSGTKRFDALSAGTYTVTAITDDGRFGRRARIALGAGQVLEPFDVVVTPGARLKLRYDGAADVATIEIVADGEFAALASIQRGTDATVVVPPGTQQVLWRIARQDGLHEQSVTLAAGEQRELAWDGKP